MTHTLRLLAAVLVACSAATGTVRAADAVAAAAAPAREPRHRIAPNIDITGPMAARSPCHAGAIEPIRMSCSGAKSLSPGGPRVRYGIAGPGGRPYFDGCDSRACKRHSTLLPAAPLPSGLAEGRWLCDPGSRTGVPFH